MTQQTITKDKVDSYQQQWQSATYDRGASFVSDLGGEIFSWLAPREGEAILDLGCGDGKLTKKIADTGARVVGFDSSQNLLESARARGLTCQHGDGQALPYNEEFDAVFSNAALHWMPDADGVISGVYRALRPQGRFVAEFGGFGNIAAIVTALHAVTKKYNLDPSLAAGWYYPRETSYADRLRGASFRVERIERIARLTPLPYGIKGWLEIFRVALLNAANETQKSQLIQDIEDMLRPSLCDDEGQWFADYVRLRVLAVKE